MTRPTCRICSSPKRGEIDRLLRSGSEAFDIGKRFGFSTLVVAKHFATHEASAVPPAPHSTVTSITKKALAPVTSAANEAPAEGPTSIPSARTVVEDLVRRIDVIVKAVEGDVVASVRDKAAIMAVALGAAKLLANLTGEATTEASLASSPQFRKVLTTVAEALGPFPTAAKAVDEALSKLEAA